MIDPTFGALQRDVGPCPACGAKAAKVLVHMGVRPSTDPHEAAAGA